MGSVWLIATSTLREAAARRWIVALLLLVTIIAALIALTLELDIVDGVLYAARLFGGSLRNDQRPADVVLRRVFEWGASLFFMTGTIFGALSCADFAPELFTPGRVEHFLALPLKRWHVLLGTYAGIMCIAVGASFYTSALLTLVLGYKSGFWSPALLVAALATSCAFAAVYGAMLAVATAVRSASASAAIGILMFVLALGLGRPSVAAAFAAGPSRALFRLSICWLPRFDLLNAMGLSLARSEAFSLDMVRAAAGAIVFGLAGVAVGIWNMERKDY